MKSEVHLIDCVEFMRGLPDKAFDLAIVDPPYQEAFNTNACADNKGKKGNYKLHTLNNHLPTAEYFDLLNRKSKNIIIWGANHFINNIPFNTSSPCWIVWDKDNTGNFADCELAWTSFNGVVRKFKYRWNGMLQEDMKNKEHRIHPTQKPISLYRWLLRNYAKPNDTIFDSHMGSQSSRIACHIEGYDFTGCELDQEYFEAGNSRYGAFLKTYGTADASTAIPGQQINLF